MYRLRTLYLGAAASLVLGASSFAMAAPANPFAAPSTLPLQAPPFDRIKDTDYEPAFEQAMKEHLTEVEAIADSKSARLSRTPSSHSKNPAACWNV
jgi:hypothetical protein